jgi:hypothetical protein
VAEYSLTAADVERLLRNCRISSFRAHIEVAQPDGTAIPVDLDVSGGSLSFHVQTEVDVAALADPYVLAAPSQTVVSMTLRPEWRSRPVANVSWNRPAIG